MSAVTPPSSVPPTDSPKVLPKETKTGDKPARKRTKKRTKRHARKNTLKTKVIVRRLPPNLPEEIFMNSVKPWISEETVDYSLYVPGKLSKSKAKESLFSRAYFHMKTMEAVVAFHQGFDGHVFMDSRGKLMMNKKMTLGNESRAVVEFAPYQKIPKEHKTADVRQGTIDQDQDYLDFLESLKEEEKSKTDLLNEPADGLTQIERLENRIAMVTAKTLAAEQANKPKTTPLLEHLRAQKAAQAASKAKKNARRRADKGSARNTADQGPKTIQQPPADVKKKRERNRKKKEVVVDGVRKPADKENAAQGWKEFSDTAAPTKPRPPREPREPKTREARPPRPPKEGAAGGGGGGNNSRPKRPARKPATDTSESSNTETKPKPIKVLGRQPGSRPSPSG
ncbi:hypothetical protein MFLAVUS_008344 [Mucor flavus]|uniref:UPF3 domain-containing protein n=1 Tax=Mucor flavus TaxID=439312 RepID=A0ABP9Z6T7_9FUNG